MLSRLLFALNLSIVQLCLSQSILRLPNAMNTLPSEILAQIIGSGLSDDNVAPYSTISRAWKASIERITFQSLKITTDELKEFAALFEGGNISRQACMANLLVTFVLPLPPNADGCCIVESPPDRAADSAAFSKSVLRLFTVLADIAARAIERRPFSLCFYRAQRRTKSGRLEYLSAKECWSNNGISRGKHSEQRIKKADENSGQFELLHSDSMPILDTVTTLELGSMLAVERLKSTWISRIVARLPNVEKLCLSTYDDCRWSSFKRIESKECL
jgi:hypothetical protein